MYFLLRCLAAAAAMVPAEALRPIARGVGAVLRWVDRKHVKRARKNLLHIGFDGTPETLIRSVYEHLGLSAMEMVVLPRLMRFRGVTPYVKFHHLERLDREWASGKGVIVVIGHLGNWELAGLAITMLGYPLRSLARPLDNPYLERWVRETRQSTGQQIISRHGALREMVEVLRRKELLAIQVDQDAKTSGVVVPFLGRPASTVRSPAVLSLKYGVPVLPVEIYRDEKGLHHADFSPPLRPEEYVAHDDPALSLTRELSLRFEEFVRRHPAQWLWLHPRWRSVTRGKVRAESAKAMNG